MIQAFKETVQLSAIYDVLIFGGCATVAILLKLLTAYYHKYNTLRWRAILGAGEFFLSGCVSFLMLAYIYLQIPDSFGLAASIASTLTGIFVCIFVHIMNLIGEKKHSLTEQQKAELMDL